MIENSECFSKKISKSGKKLLTNTIRTNDFHNKMREEEVMWRQKELMKSTQVKKLCPPPESSLPNTKSLKFPFPGRTKEKVDDRWDHSGYEALYPEEFDTPPPNKAGGRMRGFDQPTPPKPKKTRVDSSQRWDHDGYRELYPEEFESKEKSNNKTKKLGKKRSSSRPRKRRRHSSSSSSTSSSSQNHRRRSSSSSESRSPSKSRNARKSKHKKRKGSSDSSSESSSDSLPSKRSRPKKKRHSSSSSRRSMSRSSTGSSTSLDHKIKKYKKRLHYLKTKQTFRHSIRTTVLKCLKKAFSKEYLKTVLELSSSSGLSSDESDSGCPQPLTAALSSMLTPPSSSNGRKAK